MGKIRALTILAPLVGALVGCAAVALADIAVGSSTTGVSNNVTTTDLTLSKPGGTTEGDFLLANISFNGGTEVDEITIPNGWTLLSRTNNEDLVGIASYWKIASSSEPSSWTWELSIQTRAAGGITRFADVSTTDPIVGSVGSVGRGAIATASSTTAVASSTSVALFAINRGTTSSGVMSTTTGWMKLYDVKNTGMGPTVMAEQRTQANAGATSEATSTVNNGNVRDWVAQQITLRPYIPTFWVLVVGGGGSGADFVGTNQAAGGGGGGGVVEDATLELLPGSYAITVGGGGITLDPNDGADQGVNGESSSIGSEVIAGGGGGGGQLLHSSGNGRNGGSGGGGAGWGSSAGAGGSGTSGQGNAGGSGTNSLASGGGGGAGTAGGNASGASAGNGGNGVSSSISGTAVTYGGGGGGADSSGAGGNGGTGGGGAGGSTDSDGSHGGANTGGGGGGVGRDGANGVSIGGNGGSGIVIIRFATGSISVIDSTGASCTTVSSDTVCTWTSSGTFEFE